MDQSENLKAALDEIASRLKPLEAAGIGGSVAIGGFRAATATDINASTAGIFIPWDDAGFRRTDPGISIDAAHQNISVAGTPDHVVIEVNIKMRIDDTKSIQRPNQRIEIIRSDGLVLAASATGYIRDTSDHEESSHNIAVTDFLPIADASYTIKSSRESGSSDLVPLDPARSQCVVRAYSGTATVLNMMAQMVEAHSNLANEFMQTRIALENLSD